ncbi:hypothetical protein J2X69_001779 [Algoriphagus sp. 4150]|nr:hypothetical protein [Algoriphagus sp. 4150]MDR7129442.1 hypothetical protein [Algoriphagus sp. 4150]
METGQDIFEPSKIYHIYSRGMQAFQKIHQEIESDYLPEDFKSE